MSYYICFRYFVLLEMISFEKIFETVAGKFAIQCKKSRYKEFCPLLVDSFLTEISHEKKNCLKT